MKSRKIDVITNQLASYFGTITKASFVAEMLDPTYNPSSDFFQPPTPNPSDKAANALLDLTEGGKPMGEFLSSVQEILTGKDGEELEEDKAKVARTFRITFEPGVVKDDDNWHLNGCKNFGVSQGTGTKLPAYSMKEVLGIKGEGEGVTINGKPEDPDRSISRYAISD